MKSLVAGFEQRYAQRYAPPIRLWPGIGTTPRHRFGLLGYGLASAMHLRLARLVAVASTECKVSGQQSLLGAATE